MPSALIPFFNFIKLDENYHSYFKNAILNEVKVINDKIHIHLTIENNRLINNYFHIIR